MHAHRLLRHFGEADALHVAGRAAEVFVDKGRVEADGLENLRAAIGLVGRDAHLGHDLEQALVDGLDEALLGLLRLDFQGRSAMSASVSKASQGQTASAP
jgi:hypothetical protein